MEPDALASHNIHHARHSRRVDFVRGWMMQGSFLPCHNFIRWISHSCHIEELQIAVVTDEDLYSALLLDESSVALHHIVVMDARGAPLVWMCAAQ